MTNAEKLKESSINNMALLLDECFSIKEEYINDYCARCEKMHNGCPNEINRCCNRTQREMIIYWLEQKCKIVL